MFRRGDDEDLLTPSRPDTPIDMTNTMGAGTNLRQATVVILHAPIYDPKVMSQGPKQAHRMDNLNEVWDYGVSPRTVTNNLVNGKQAVKSGFTAETFQLMVTD